MIIRIQVNYILSHPLHKEEQNLKNYTKITDTPESLLVVKDKFKY